MNTLEQIFKSCRLALEIKKSRISLSEMKFKAADSGKTRNFANALELPDRIAIIAEIKFRSPSHGLLHDKLSTEVIADQYERAGANALSVLTEEQYFGGHLENINRAKRTCKLPILRKDFLFHPYQVYESRANGADAILLIAAMLESNQMKELSELARELDLAILLELHNEDDLAKAEGLQSVIWGVNHRNLKTLSIDLNISRQLFSLLPQKSLKVAESGIESHAQLSEMKKYGANAALIGSSLMSTDAPGDALKKLLSP